MRCCLGQVSAGEDEMPVSSFETIIGSILVTHQL